MRVRDGTPSEVESGMDINERIALMVRASAKIGMFSECIEGVRMHIEFSSTGRVKILVWAWC